MMRSKKGLELSINFMVILIMSIVIFVGGIYFTNKFFNVANKQKQDIDQETEAQIRNLLSDGAKVAVPFNKASLNKNEGHVFGVGIHNIHQGRAVFLINVTYDDKSAFDPRGNPIGANSTYMNQWLLFSNGNVSVDPNSDKNVAIYAKVKGKINESSGPLKGEYAFNVCVYEKPATGTPNLRCPPSPVAGTTYDMFVHKFYIDVK